MAQKLDLEVTLKTELDKAGKGLERLQQAGAFSGGAGAKNFTRIKSLIEQLNSVDLTKLKGPELTNFLNNLGKLRQYMDTAAKSLTNFSDDYKKALDKVEQSSRKLSSAQDRLNEAQEKNLKATTKSASIADKLKQGFTYKNTTTGGYPRTPEAIAKAYSEGALQVYGPKDKTTPLRDAALEAHLRSAGIPELAASNVEVEKFKQEVKEAAEALKAAKEALERTPTGTTLHPETSTTVQESQSTRDVISNIKEQVSQETEDEIKQVNLESEKLTDNLNRQTSSLSKAFKQFTAYAIALRMTKKALHEAVSTVKELDRALTEQAMVTGLTRKQTYGLLKDYQDMASRLGATTKEVSSTMTEFLRQGRSIAEASKLTEAAVAAAKIAGISTAESINYLTTAVNGFRLSAEDAMKVSDKFAAVAATAAVSYDEIAIALSKVAAQANLAGMSIDYTTALLTKGIETTREAPETIGTALKTVIARMRELTDYGATLEGDTDVNNVESQLAYIGIQLRDVNGELRSTEDVLNELGGKWDDLNANQQAAIAKALAGTRQQSRLIAMMQDYERVTELQQIAERSAGATMAQMATYMEGMDAALNKVNVAWEKIVSSIVNSDFIIGIVDTFSKVLGYVGTLFSETYALVPVVTLLILKGTQYLGLKLQEQHIARETQKINAQIALNDIKMRRDEQKLLVERLNTQLKLIEATYKEAKAKLLSRKEAGEITEEQYKEEVALLDREKKEVSDQLDLETKKLDLYEKQVEYREQENNDIQALTQSYQGYANTFKLVANNIKSVFTIIPRLIQGFQAAKEAADASKGGLREQSAAYIPFIGWAISLALEGISAAMFITQAVTALGKWINEQNKDRTAENINKISAEIYNLNKKATELDTTISKFDELDKKVIKTKDDLKEMSSILASAADSLTEEEKDIFSGLQTDRARRDYLANVQANTQLELAGARENQRNKILNVRGSSYQSLLTSQEGEWVQARDAIFALNNAALYDVIDSNADYKEGTEQLLQTLLETLNVEEALAVLRDQDRIADYAASVQSSVEVFQDESKSIRERVEAYRELSSTISSDLSSALKEAYSDWEALSSLKDGTIEWIDSMGASVDQINKFAAAMRKVGIDSEETLDYFEKFVQNESYLDLKTAFEATFGENAQAMLTEFDKIFGTTILNMGQNIDKFSNKIDSVYEKAGKWASMNNTERTQFLSENAAMFEGAEGQKLLDAFNTGDYAQISAALANNKALQEERDLLIKNLDLQIQIEKSRENINYAHLQELEEYKAYLEDTENLYLASLETRLKQQDDQLSAYKEYLQKENDALTDSLNKRKDAYQKYFEEINKKAEDQDYEDKAQLLIANISKLSSSTNADAMAKTADLTKQLEDLEKERLQTLRERAQELVIQNIEDEVTRISDNLEKLLNNEQALLNAMLADTQDSSQFISSMIAAQVATGNNTELGLESYLATMQSTFSMLMPNVDWSDIDVVRQGDSLVLNIAGQPIDLTSGEQQTIFDAIQNALKQIGKN